MNCHPQREEMLEGGTAGPFTWLDALAASYTSDNKYVITSPNTDFVPEPFVGLVHVHLRKDYRYGVHDPTQWPQIFTPGFEYLCAIRRRVPDGSPHSPVWSTPSDPSDFMVVEGSAFTSLGLLSERWYAPLKNLVDELTEKVNKHQASCVIPDDTLTHLSTAMRRAQDRILHFPSTFRDAVLQVRSVQRLWLRCQAYLDYHHILTAPQPGEVERCYMGAFTTNPSIVQLLFDIGLPVWFIRPDASVLDSTKVFAVICLEQASSVEMQLWQSGATPLYSGLVGAAHLEATSRNPLVYLDIPHAPLLSPYDPDTFSRRDNDADTDHEAVARRTSPTVSNRPRSRHNQSPYTRPLHASHTRGRDKFMNLVHDWMPASLSAWQQAMQGVDRSAPAKRGPQLWGYWIPEPGLLLGPKMAERSLRYLSNWLRIRPAWMYVLATPQPGVTRVQPQWWRDYLNGDTETMLVPNNTYRARRLEAVKAVFGRALDMGAYVGLGAKTVRWFSYRVGQLDAHLCKLVLWEIHELGFCQELLALDRVLVPACDETWREELLARVFVSHDLYSIHTLPSVPIGLGADLPQARARYLEALWQVLIRWPLCPSVLHAGQPLALTTRRDRIECLELAMTSFYVSTFFVYSGRAPIVPHALPT
ncbi:hypothetical protein C8Q76DRAFT_772315 [Earliella scabrosa]|nr:hypothetical protein C8Q76DRAFT_772315 [Earliella scabrosa]